MRQQAATLTVDLLRFTLNKRPLEVTISPPPVGDQQNTHSSIKLSLFIRSKAGYRKEKQGLLLSSCIFQLPKGNSRTLKEKTDLLLSSEATAVFAEFSLRYHFRSSVLPVSTASGLCALCHRNSCVMLRKPTRPSVMYGASEKHLSEKERTVVSCLF
ncbi:hypothetical protein F2P81_019444 [Scophthalmus maximus]|uniref:Uncharacterized protein n=1 Tax=Scophthalmus maximus TaxID=52904 RepID=A0A6A4S5R2_SCOMX|nr:hypothetical protein F2P81_019444 [Scophthalmus maximus]